MIDIRRISAQHYYDVLPHPKHQCGDIWTGISTLGLLGTAPVSGIVVTPACDLSNAKTETITFLPVIPLRSFFSTLASLPDLKKAIEIGLNGSALDLQIPWGAHKFRPPSSVSINEAISAIESYLGAKQRSAKEIVALNRAKAGLKILLLVTIPDLVEVAGCDLAVTFKDWDEIKSKIIRNSYGSFMHFLPADEQYIQFSGLSSHSIVMFRYPITVPVEVLDLANGNYEQNWRNVVDINIDAVPFLINYREHMPMKTLRLKSEFLSDLLSRYVTVYNRIGSPDFTPASIERFCTEVDR